MRLLKIMKKIHNLNKLSTEQFLVMIDQLRQDIGLHLLPQQQVWMLPKSFFNMMVLKQSS
jgi:hypothetical protein